MVISEASLATEVPSPIERPTCAALRAGASLVPSPVTATTSPFCWSRFTKRALSSGRAREITRRSPMRSKSSASLIAANSTPVIWLRSVQVSSHKRIWRAISLAVPGVSPVTIFT